MLSVVILQRNIKLNDHIDPFYFKLLLPMKPPRPTRKHRQQQLPMPMGPRDTIHNSSDIFRWAHAIPLAAATYFDGPMRSHRQKQLYLPMGSFDPFGSSCSICQWAHAKPSATAAAYFDGLIEKSDFCCGWLLAGLSTEAAVYTNGPIRSLRQQQPHIPMGPRETIGNSSRLFR